MIDKFHFEKKVYVQKDYVFDFSVDEDLLSDILEHKKTGTVLDLGCGEGGSSLVLADKGFIVTCVDISPKVIAALQEEATKRNVLIRAKVADVELFSLSEQYDIVLGMGILHFIAPENRTAFFKKLQEHTAPAGIHIFDFFREESLDHTYFERVYTGWSFLEYANYEDEEKNAMSYIILQR